MSYPALRRLLSEAGYQFVEPPIVHEANVFVELAGEDLRRRLYLTSDASGRELALRPDYTIPVCLHHIAGGPAKRRGDYAYLGPVFRQRAAGPGEFMQAGVESLGRANRATADAELLKLALSAAALFGVARPRVRIGDSALFAAVLAALDVSSPWRRRLARAFGSERVTALVAKSATEAKGGAHDGVLAALDGADHEAAQKLVEDLLALAGIRAIGGRTPGEIAERFLEKSAIAAGIGARAAAVLARYLAVSGTPEKALAALRGLAKAEKLDLGKALDGFAKRVDGFAAAGIDLSRLTFAADFGRRLDYYTGFVFEIHDPRRKEGHIIGGGRYDRLMGLIAGSSEAVPAVGFSVWLDRVGSEVSP